MDTRRIALVRHPAPAIAAGICYGRLDIGLAQDAEPRLAMILAALSGWSPAQIWTSPARRCRLVADAIGQAFGGQAIPDARLLELHFGDWEGRAWHDISRTDLDAWAASPAGFAPPGGESGHQVAARVGAFHAMLAGEAGDAVIVSHGGPLKILAALLHGRPIDLLVAAPPLGSVDVITVQATTPAR